MQKADLTGTILVVTLPGQGAVGELHTHYFNPNAKQGKIRDALSRWFSIWGIPLTHSVNHPNAIEKAMHEVPWCDQVPEHLHGPQTVRYYADNARAVIDAVTRLRPRIIFVLSAYLFEAMASEAVAPAIQSVIGRAKMPAHRITQMRLKALHQEFENAHIIVLPTPSKNTTDEYVASLSAPVRQCFTQVGFNLSETSDSLLSAARALIVVDEARTIEKLQNQLRIDRQRAQALFEELVEDGMISAPDAKGVRYALQRK